MADEHIPDIEPKLHHMLRQRAARRSLPPYSAKRDADVLDALRRFYAIHLPGAAVERLARVGGGASKEQFFFDLLRSDGQRQRCVLRMDPLEAITETDRQREFEVLKAVRAIVPVPEPLWLDADGTCFDRPAAIMALVPGVTKPSGGEVRVSGLGTLLGPILREKLRAPFLNHLVALHALDWRRAELPSFDAPDADPEQAARWTLNYWREMLRIDRIEHLPIVALAEQWLLDNLPSCTDLVLTHGDYRTGNYLFSEESGHMTAILDWELARIGDYHEDVAWVLMRVFGTCAGGQFRAGDLYGREEFIKAYEVASGRAVNRRTLHFYEVLSSWKCYVIVAANGVSVARARHNHQDVLLTFLAGAGPIFTADLCRLLQEEIAA